MVSAAGISGNLENCFTSIMRKLLFRDPGRALAYRSFWDEGMGRILQMSNQIMLSISIN